MQTKKTLLLLAAMLPVIVADAQAFRAEDVAWAKPPAWQAQRGEAMTAVTDKADKADWTAAARSAIVPGWGQMGKGHTGEGIATLLGEVALVGGAVGTYVWGSQLAAQLERGFATTEDYAPVHAQYRALTTANHVLWGAVAALWLFNVYRAFVADPNHRGVATVAPGFIAVPGETLPAVGIAIEL